MSIKIYLDGADLGAMRSWADDPRIAGFTTNPSLAFASGITRYRAFAERALEIARGLPVSIEVLADNLSEIGRQARAIAAMGDNAVVKIPVVNSLGQSTAAVVDDLAGSGIKLNVTAVFTPAQTSEVGRALSGELSSTLVGGKRAAVSRAPRIIPAVVSVFAGRVADAGVDPLEHVKKCRDSLRAACPRAEMLWASARQVYDVVLAERAGCEIITLSPALLSKLRLVGKDLEAYSRETAAEFAADALAAGFEL